MRRVLPIVMVSAAVLAAGCDSGRPAYYVGSDRTATVLITWSAQHNGRASGSITDDIMSGSAPGETVTVQTVPVTVRFSGSDVSFSGAGIDTLGAATIKGALSAGRLTITAPDANGYLGSAVLRAGAPAVYHSDLARLRQLADRADTAARRSQGRQQNPGQVATDQQQVSTDIAALQGDASQLGSDVTQMGADVQQVSADLGQLKSDAANGAGPSCDNVSTVDSDATTVDNDGTTVGNDASTVTGDIQTVQGDISQLTSDLAALHKAGGSPAGSPSPQTVIGQAQATVSSSLGQANSYIATVNGYLQTAYTTANSLAADTCAS